MQNIERWKSRGRLVEVFGHQVFVVEAGEPQAPALLLLHGYPTSCMDFEPVLDRFAERYRVITHDHLGFGLSDKPTDYSYSLLEQGEVALQLWRQLGVNRAHLVAHDYGTSVATEVLARRERMGIDLELQSLTLCNGSMHIELAEPRLIQWLLAGQLGPTVAKLSSYALFRRNMKKILGKPEAVSEQDLKDMWALLERQEGRSNFAQITRYLHERRKYWHRWIGALTRFEPPTLVLWGDRDPVALPAIAEALAGEMPDVRLEWLRGLGHYPMLEDPGAWGDGVMGFLEGVA